MGRMAKRGTAARANARGVRTRASGLPVENLMLGQMQNSQTQRARGRGRGRGAGRGKVAGGQNGDGLLPHQELAVMQSQNLNSGDVNLQQSNQNIGSVPNDAESTTESDAESYS